MSKQRGQHKVIIIGTGPAGLTAAIYTARANLEPVIFEGSQPGGQLMITTDIENYPGFEKGIAGPELMDIMRKQAQRFGATSYFKTITKVDFSSKPHKVWTDDGTEFTSDTVIIATGASAKYLGIESEKKFMGSDTCMCYVRRIFLQKPESCCSRRRRYSDGRSKLFNTSRF